VLLKRTTLICLKNRRGTPWRSITDVEAAMAKRPLP
jgi:hypothetical protein